MKINSILPIAITLGFAIIPVPGTAAAVPSSQEQALKAREFQADLLHDEIASLDRSIERRIDVILDTLRSIGDSKDSGGKVARMKEQTMEALKKTIGYYETKRAALQEEMKQPTLRLTDEQKRKGVETFDARIEKRMAQIVAVQKSLPGHKDYERYRLELRESIAKTEQQSRALKTKNASAEEIAKNDALLAQRRKQLAASLAPTGATTQNVGQSQAQDLNKVLGREVGELRTDFGKLFARYSSYIQELSAVNQARAALKPAS